jgi:hypothetical protein
MGALKMQAERCQVVVNSYDAKIDSKNRISIRKSKDISYYHVEELEDGRIILSPRVLASPEEVISKKALAVLKESISNFHGGRVSDESFDSKAHPELLEDDEE